MNAEQLQEQILEIMSYGQSLAMMRRAAADTFVKALGCRLFAFRSLKASANATERPIPEGDRP